MEKLYIVVILRILGCIITGFMREIMNPCFIALYVVIVCNQICARAAHH